MLVEYRLEHPCGGLSKHKESFEEFQPSKCARLSIVVLGQVWSQHPEAVSVFIDSIRLNSGQLLYFTEQDFR
jgi:hypothetical protein